MKGTRRNTCDETFALNVLNKFQMVERAVVVRNAGRRMKQALNQLFDNFQSAEFIDEDIIEVVLPVIPRRIGSILAGTKIYCANVDLSLWTMNLFATREEYESSQVTEKIKIGLNYGREEIQAGGGPSQITEGSY